MVTDATRKYRDIIAIGLVAVAAVYFVAALSMLFTVGNGYADGALDFTDKAALTSDSFPSLIPMAALVVAALLVTRYGDVGPVSRLVILAALGIAALDLLFGIITYFAQFGSGFGIAGPANKFVTAMFGLALLLLLALVLLYLYTALRSLPAATPASQPQWGAPGQPGYAGWGQPGSGSPGQGQAGYAPPGSAQPPWQQPAPTYGWGQPEAGTQQPGWGASAGQGTAAGGWGAPSDGWHDPAAAQQGQPASAWSQAGQEWGTSTSAAATPQWEQPQPSQQEQQPGWGAPTGASVWRPDESTDISDDPPADGAAYDGAAHDDVVPADAGSDGAADESGTEEQAEEPGGWWRRTEK